MFNNDPDKKSGKPVRGYRWMCFTFIMIILLSVIVMFHDEFEAAKKNTIAAVKKGTLDGIDAITGKGE